MKAKSWEELSKIAQSFRGLSEEKKNEAVKALSDKIKRSEEAREEVLKQIGEVTEDLDAASGKQNTLSQEIIRLSGKVPTLLAFNQDVQEVNSSIKKLTEESNRLGQMIAGFRGRIYGLKNEVPLLDDEIDEDRWLRKFYKLVPLADRWNKKAVELIPILEEIWNVSEDMNFTMHPLTSGQKVVYPSSWDALERIPQFFLVGDKEDRWANGRLKDLWTMDEFKFERRRKREAEK